MYKFMARLFSVLGVCLFLYSFFFMWSRAVGYIQSGIFAWLIIEFFVKVIVAALLFFMGDFMKRIEDEERAIDRLLIKPYKKDKGARK